jgi:hypothetical protein
LTKGLKPCYHVIDAALHLTKEIEMATRFEVILSEAQCARIVVALDLLRNSHEGRDMATGEEDDPACLMSMFDDLAPDGVNDLTL